MPLSNREFVSRHPTFVNQSIWQFTLRQLQELLGNLRFWMGYSAVVVILALTGPFGTLNTIAGPKRLVYWATICLLTFLVGMATSYFVGLSAARLGANELISRAVGAVFSGLPVGVTAWVLNIYLFKIDIASAYSFIEFIGYTTLIAVLIVVLSWLVIGKNDGIEELSDQPASTSFFDRLPKHLGRQIIHLEAQDHYVRVTTRIGSDLILLRLADAERELSGFDGLRVHRSWWIAAGEISTFKRQDGRLKLIMSNNAEIPVSRSRLAGLKAAGILQ